MEIERPILFVVLAITAGLFFFFKSKRKMGAGFPSLKHLPENRTAIAMNFLREFALPVGIAIGLIFLAAGFNFSSKEITRYGYGSDIVVVLDESGSMDVPFSKSKPEEKIGKIQAAKKLIRPFIKERKDRMSLVVFGDVVVPIYPLSFNQEGFLRSFDAQTASLGGTLIDIGIAQALKILEESPARTKIILFISDGGGRIEDERFQLSSRMKEMGVRFYWLAVDHQVHFDGEGPSFMGKLIPNLNPAMTMIIPIDDVQGLQKAFEEIDKLERSLIFYKEKAERGNVFWLVCWILLAMSAAFYALDCIHND
jgi:Ca-activated chloride channel family protein